MGEGGRGGGLGGGVARLICSFYCLVGLVVKASAYRAEDPEFDSRLRRLDFFRVELYQ